MSVEISIQDEPSIAFSHADHVILGQMLNLTCYYLAESNTTTFGWVLLEKRDGKVKHDYGTIGNRYVTQVNFTKKIAISCYIIESGQRILSYAVEFHTQLPIYHSTDGVLSSSLGRPVNYLTQGNYVLYNQ